MRYQPLNTRVGQCDRGCFVDVGEAEPVVVADIGDDGGGLGLHPHTSQVSNPLTSQIRVSVAVLVVMVLSVR